MKFTELLGKMELAAFIALMIVSAFAAGVVGVQNYVADAPVFSTPNAAGIAFVYAFAIGSGPTFLLGAPIYSLLYQRGWGTWTAAAVLGGFPGLLLISVDRSFAEWFIVCGLAVSLITHTISQRVHQAKLSTPE